jgi:hypothetical protein
MKSNNNIDVKIILIYLLVPLFLYSNLYCSVKNTKISESSNVRLIIYYKPIRLLLSYPHYPKNLIKSYDYKITICNSQLDIHDIKSLLNVSLKKKKVKKTKGRVVGFFLFAQLVDENTDNVIYSFAIAFHREYMLVNGEFFYEDARFIEFIKQYLPYKEAKDIDEYIDHNYKE